jgi:hypothetical protein
MASPWPLAFSLIGAQGATGPSGGLQGAQGVQGPQGGGTSITNAGATVACTSGGNVTLSAGTSGTINMNTNLNLDITGRILSFNQMGNVNAASISGLSTINGLNINESTYNGSALTSTYWTPTPPVTLQSAIDRLASAVYSLRSNTAIP